MNNHFNGDEINADILIRILVNLKPINTSLLTYIDFKTTDMLNPAGDQIQNYIHSHLIYTPEEKKILFHIMNQDDLLPIRNYIGGIYCYILIITTWIDTLFLKATTSGSRDDVLTAIIHISNLPTGFNIAENKDDLSSINLYPDYFTEQEQDGRPVYVCEIIPPISPAFIETIREILFQHYSGTFVARKEEKERELRFDEQGRLIDEMGKLIDVGAGEEKSFEEEL